MDRFNEVPNIHITKLTNDDEGNVYGKFFAVASREIEIMRNLLPKEIASLEKEIKQLRAKISVLRLMRPAELLVDSIQARIKFLSNIVELCEEQMIKLQLDQNRLAALPAM